MTEPFEPTLVRNMLIVAAVFSVVAVLCALIAVDQIGGALRVIESKEAAPKAAR